MELHEWQIWTGIVVCLSQSAMFSGLNIAMFSISRLRLEVESAQGSVGAKRVLEFRKQSNHVLATILWGNVAINVLLALLSDSVMTGVAAFAFSTVVITFLGEIFPQAWFSRNALKMAALLAPLLRFYLLILYPVAKPSSLILDAWLGQEGIHYYHERGLREVIRKHIAQDNSEIDHIEGIGALNFLDIDDLPLDALGTVITPDSVVELPFENDLPVFPPFSRSPDDAFLGRLHEGRHRSWTVIADPSGEPRFVLDTHRFLSEALLGESIPDPQNFLYRPAVLKDPDARLGPALPNLGAPPLAPTAAIPERNVILAWYATPRIITGDEILHRLLRGVLPRPVAAGSGTVRPHPA